MSTREEREAIRAEAEANRHRDEAAAAEHAARQSGAWGKRLQQQQDPNDIFRF